MTKTVVLQQQGWEITGEVLVTLWGGGQGVLKMNKAFVSLGQLTRDTVHKSINDGSFGVESIDTAFVDIAEIYGRYGMPDDFVSIHRASLEIKHPSPSLVRRGI